MRHFRLPKHLLWLPFLAAGVVMFVNCSPTSESPKGSPGQTDTANPTAPQMPVVMVVPVVSQELQKTLRLPGELTAFEDVAVYPKISGFVESIPVDLGSKVKRGQVLVRMKAPELLSQLSEAQSRANAAKEQRLQAEARLRSVGAQRQEAEANMSAEETTYIRLKAAAATPGVVAGIDLELAQKKVEAGRAHVAVVEANEKAAQAEIETYRDNEKAAREALGAVQALESYLTLTAPFDGVITERNAHPGSLALPSNSPTTSPLLRVRQISRLRLTVAVPEINTAGVKTGTPLKFTVPAFPGEPFTGTIRRIGDAFDPKTRTMPIELDVDNASGRLAPGMFPEVLLAVQRPQPSLFVPPSALATTTERTFVVRIKNGMTEWVDVKRGQSLEKLVEVFGQLTAGDQVAMRGTDELRPGIRVTSKSPPPDNPSQK